MKHYMYTARPVFVGFLLVASTSASLFSSNFFLVKLAKFEQRLLPELVQQMNNSNVAALITLKGFLEEVQVSTLKFPEDYVAQPFNSVYMLRRWVELLKTPYGEDQQMSRFIETLKERAAEELPSIPDEIDVTEAVSGIIRLQIVYNLTAEDLQRGELAGFLPVYNLFYRDYALFELAAIYYNAPESAKIRVGWLQQYLKNGGTETGRLNACVMLVQLCTNLSDWACVEKYAWQAHSIDPDHVTRAQVLATLSQHEVDESPNVSSSIPQVGSSYTAVADETTRLCSSRTTTALNDSTYVQNLTCDYVAAGPPYYRFRREKLSLDPPLVLFHDVVSEFEAELVIRSAEGKLQVSKTNVGRRSRRRVSATAWLWEQRSHVVKKISRRIAGITGLHTFSDHEFLHYSENPDRADVTSESFQIINYGVAGHYIPHLDYMTLTNSTPDLQTINQSQANSVLDTEAIKQSPTTSTPEIEAVKKSLVMTGNRLATFLLYLTDVPAGGATFFPRLNISVAPRRGSALFWYNTKRSGNVDPRLLHGACPVMYGNKWVANKWICERGQEFKRPCGLSPDE